MWEECAKALLDNIELLVVTHLLAFLAGIGVFALYQRARGGPRL